MNLFHFTYEFENADLEEPTYPLLTVTGTVSRYRPARMYLANGDPGYPAEGGEIEDLEVHDAWGREVDCEAFFVERQSFFKEIKQCLMPCCNSNVAPAGFHCRFQNPDFTL